MEIAVTADNSDNAIIRLTTNNKARSMSGLPVGPAGQLSNLLIEDLIKIDTFYTNHGKFIKAGH
jgi:hypothetical protein